MAKRVGPAMSAPSKNTLLPPINARDFVSLGVVEKNHVEKCHFRCSTEQTEFFRVCFAQAKCRLALTFAFDFVTSAFLHAKANGITSGALFRALTWTAMSTNE